MVTFGRKNEPHSRPMTNFNSNPYSTMWFPTEAGTQKVRDLKRNPKTLILFPDTDKKTFYELEGHSTFGDAEEVEEKWVWWYLYWHPEQREMFWFDPKELHPDKAIIDFHPVAMKTLSVKDVKYINETYKTVIPKTLA